MESNTAKPKKNIGTLIQWFSIPTASNGMEIKAKNMMVPPTMNKAKIILSITLNSPRYLCRNHRLDLAPHRRNIRSIHPQIRCRHIGGMSGHSRPVQNLHSHNSQDRLSFHLMRRIQNTSRFRLHTIVSYLSASCASGLRTLAYYQTTQSPARAMVPALPSSALSACAHHQCVTFRPTTPTP